MESKSRRERKGKKPIKDTAIGQWIGNNMPGILETVGDVLPDKGVLGILKRLIDKDTDLTPEQKLEFERLYQQERMNMEDNISERWGHDMSSDSWLSKNVRPLTLISLLVYTFTAMILDSIPSIDFSIKEYWVELLGGLLTTVVIAYFGARTYEKKGLDFWRKG
jgi:hypothetical protein